MFTSHWKFGMMDFDDVKRVRQSVFVEELGVPEDRAFDWFDGIAAHLLLLDENKQPMAAGRMYPDGDLTRLDWIGVMKPFRGMPYDEFVLRMLLYKAQTLAGSEIAAQAPVDQLPLYTAFGLVPWGDSARIGGYPVQELRVGRDRIHWHSACKGGK